MTRLSVCREARRPALIRCAMAASVEDRIWIDAHPLPQELLLQFDDDRHGIIVGGLVELDHHPLDRADGHAAVLDRGAFVQAVQRVVEVDDDVAGRAERASRS